MARGSALGSPGERGGRSPTAAPTASWKRDTLAGLDKGSRVWMQTSGGAWALGTLRAPVAAQCRVALDTRQGEAAGQARAAAAEPAPHCRQPWVLGHARGQDGRARIGRACIRTRAAALAKVAGVQQACGAGVQPPALNAGAPRPCRTGRAARGPAVRASARPGRSASGGPRGARRCRAWRRARWCRPTRASWTARPT